MRDPDNLHLGKSRRLGLVAASQKECRELIRWTTFLGQPMVFVCALSHIFKNSEYTYIFNVQWTSTNNHKTMVFNSSDRSFGSYDTLVYVDL